MGAVNCAVIVGVAIICVLTVRESFLQKRRLAKSENWWGTVKQPYLAAIGNQYSARGLT